jgi:hypothetical protein
MHRKSAPSTRLSPLTKPTTSYYLTTPY